MLGGPDFAISQIPPAAGVNVDEVFGVTTLSNSSVLCVGSITRKESKSARKNGFEAHGTDYFLFLASQSKSQKPQRQRVAEIQRLEQLGTENG